ncbi:MAG: carbamoyltransferase [Mycobacterium sp.]
MNILGISAYYHDSAAALVSDGRVVAAAQEERFTRRRHDAAFPIQAIAYCLHAGDVSDDAVDAVVFYDKPITKFVRILRTQLSVAPKGIRPFLRAVPAWTQSKLWVRYHIEKELRSLGYRPPGDVFFTEHHASHAASAFFPSPFQRAAILTLDGVGEWATSSLGLGHDNEIELLEELRFPHSLGLLYSAFTQFCGFRVNSGEYKLMGLAPYGKAKYKERILSELIDLRKDGSFRLNMDFFGYLSDLTMTNQKFADLFDGPSRLPETELSQREADLAASVQAVTEDVVLRIGRHLHGLTGESKCVLAGGVALNCVANGRLLREGPFEQLWIQPAAGDAGGALGAALYGWHQIQGGERSVDGVHDQMQGAFLGPSFDGDEIVEYLEQAGYPYKRIVDPEVRAQRIAELVADQQVVGLFQGRMEFGPRALGHRSIIGDARSAKMQSVMNLKIKNRESFRPFAPSVLRDRTSEFFELDVESPYMLLVASLQEDQRLPAPDSTDAAAGFWDRVNETRSSLPAITHVDHSARIQTVTNEDNPLYAPILAALDQLTGCPVVINTSFNVRGEPIVCTPEDAYRCFMRTDMDYLVLEDCILAKPDQPDTEGTDDWKRIFPLD